MHIWRTNAAPRHLCSGRMRPHQGEFIESIYLLNPMLLHHQCRLFIAFCLRKCQGCPAKARGTTEAGRRTRLSSLFARGAEASCVQYAYRVFHPVVLLASKWQEVDRSNALNCIKSGKHREGDRERERERA